MLVALLLLLVFTLRTTVVSIFSSISCPLVMTIVISMVFINNPGVMSNNTRMVITRLLLFMALFFSRCSHPGLLARQPRRLPTREGRQRWTRSRRILLPRRRRTWSPSINSTCHLLFLI